MVVQLDPRPLPNHRLQARRIPHLEEGQTMIELGKYDKSAVEELRADLRSRIAQAEMALHKTLEQLESYRDNVSSDEESDDLTDCMKRAHREHYAAIAPLRAAFDQIIKAQVAIRMFEPLNLVVPEPPQRT